jgi:hypothetical protein
MTTVSQLIDDCSGMLHSYTGTLEATTWLTQPVDAATIEIPVAHPNRLRQGIIEIDDELMWVSDAGDASVTLQPAGRGVMNTTPASHAVTTRVTNDPLIPRARLFQEIQATIRQMQPDLYAEKAYSFTVSPVQTTYPIPADVIKLLQVQHDVVGPTQEWLTMTSFWIDQNATTNTGKALTLRGCIDPGRTVQLVYASDLPVPANSSVDLEASGIPAEMHDVIRYGACWRVIQTLPVGRLNLRSIEAQTNADQVTPAVISEISKQFAQMFQLRRQEERQRQLDKYPPRKHYVR